MNRSRLKARGQERRPRVLIVGPLPPPLHGVSVLTEALLRSELLARYDIDHLDTRDDRGVANIGRLDVGNVLLAAQHGVQFARKVARRRPDLVYMPVAQNTLGFARDALFMLPTVAAGTRLVLHFHGGRFDGFQAESSIPVRRAVRGLVGRAHRAIVLGEALRGMLADVVAPERIRVVPNGVEDPGAGDTAADGPLRVLFIGNLRPDKGYIDLLEAGLELVSRGVPLELTFVGGIADVSAHEAALKRFSPPQSAVRFTGAVDSVGRDEELRRAHVLVLPSRDEAHPLVVLEAMAAGLPVIASRHSTLPETVLDGTTGLLVETGRPDQIAAALERLLDADVRSLMGSAGRARYEAEYTLARWQERMQDVFDDALDGGVTT